MDILKYFLFFFIIYHFCLVLLSVDSRSTPSILTSEFACPKHRVVHIGVVIDQRSRVGRELKIAMELAVQDFSPCLNLVLHLRDSDGNLARATSAAIDLVKHDQVDAIVGTLTLQQAALLSEFKTRKSNIPIISLSPSQQTPPKSPYFIHLSTPITHQTQCVAALIRHFRWRKVLLLHEQFDDQAGLLSTYLSDALRAVGSSLDGHLSFPRISSLLDPKGYIQQELENAGTENVRVLVVMQCSLEFAVILFEKAKELGMMGKGYVWIVSDEIANLLDSLDISVVLNMQGVVGLTLDYPDTNEHFKEFKSKFRRKYRSQYPAEEESSNPSIYSSRAYDTIWALANATLNDSEGKINSTELVNHTDFQGLSGKIDFKNGFPSEKPIFRIVNVIGRSYREVARWSLEFGFSDRTNLMSSIYWPGGSQTVPKGWTVGSSERPLRIGVPAKGAFTQFVKVTYDLGLNTTLISGFSIEVFEAAVKELPYDLYYVFVPYYGSYDEMVAEVHNKSLDAAVGDTEIMADRYAYAEFSQPYIESGLVMVVTAKPGLKESKLVALNAFTKNMWIELAVVSISTGAIIWLSEYAAGNEQFTKNSWLKLIGSILWLSVTIISFSQREDIKNSASRLVLATWKCVVVVVAASFTAVLSSMMTVPRLQPSVVDIDYLRTTNAAVGCNKNSFIVRYLIDVLQFKHENVWRINSIDEYPKHFESGDIKAAFFVAPHAKVFLAKYCKGYTISGPTLRLGGFGFVFPRGSPLAIDISEAILRVTQSGHLNTLEENMLQRSNCKTSSNNIADDMKLGPEPFSGLFQVLGVIIGVAFFIAIVRLVRKKCISIYDFVQKVLIMHRVCMWASMVLGSIDFRKEIVQMNVNSE